jgi:hypothetical protein
MEGEDVSEIAQALTTFFLFSAVAGAVIGLVFAFAHDLGYARGIAAIAHRNQTLQESKKAKGALEFDPFKD